jgi:hypothetical protein
MQDITGTLERLTHVTGDTWRIKLQGRRAVTVTSALLDGVWIDYSRAVYAITIDDARNAVSIKGAK